MNLTHVEAEVVSDSSCALSAILTRELKSVNAITSTDSHVDG